MASLINSTQQIDVLNVNLVNNATLGEDFLNLLNETAASGIGLKLYDNFPVWILAIYFANIGVGAFFNGLSFIAILKSQRNGILTIILQLTAIDIISTYVSFIEIWSLKSNTWLFPSDMCPLFSGTEVLTNSLTLYLIISLNFHTISVSNLSKFEKSTNPLTSCDASSECLVTRNEPRAITIDYRRRKNDVSVIIPCILVWFICLSLSIPPFTLSSTIRIYNQNNNSTIMCTLVDIYYGKLLQNLLHIFRVLIPIPLLLLTFAILFKKLYDNTRKNNIENIFTKKSDNILYYLIFCLIINCLYFLTSLQRYVLYFLHTINHEFVIDSIDSFKMPPLYNNYVTDYIIVLSMLHYSGSFIRFLIYLFCLPKFQALFCNKIFLCFKNK